MRWWVVSLLAVAGGLVALNLSGFCYYQCRWLSDQEICDKVITRDLPIISKKFGEGNYYQNTTDLHAAWIERWRAKQRIRNTEPRIGQFASGCAIARWDASEIIDWDLSWLGKVFGFYQVSVEVVHLSRDEKFRLKSVAILNACGKARMHRCCQHP
jgi:hypothetical protein